MKRSDSKAALALNAIIRGLEFDQVNFRYDPHAGSLPPELEELAAAAAVGGGHERSREA